MRKSKFIYHNVHFLKSAAKCEQLPPDNGIEIAFAGRSNAGKSSVINAITNIKQLAKSSKTPGRTQLINLFELDENRRLVDLPGYGYANVAKTIKQHWQHELARYLENRQCLQGLVLIMDIRHPLREFDDLMLRWAAESELPIHILLNKADKLKRGATMSTLHQVTKQVKAYEGNVSIQPFSALKKTGIEEAQAVLDSWFA